MCVKGAKVRIYGQTWHARNEAGMVQKKPTMISRAREERTRGLLGRCRVRGRALMMDDK